MRIRLLAIVPICLVITATHGCASEGGQLLVGTVVSGGINVHDAAFGGLPGVHSCCSSFRTQWSPTIGIAGIIERNGYLLASLPAALQLRLGINHLGGTFTSDEFIGNIILGDSLVRGISRHQLETRLWAVSVEPQVRLLLPTHHVLSFDIGGRFDWIPIARFAQEEYLTTPSRGAYFETRTQTRNAASGSIPTAARLGAAVSFGLNYSVAFESGWTIRPELRTYVGLTRLADVPWHVHRIVVGIAILHRPESVPPIVPTQAPIVETPPPLVFDIETRVLGVHQRSGDTAIVEIPVRSIERRSTVVPVVFFARQSAALDSTAERHIADIARAAQRMTEPISLAPSIAPDEPDSIRQLRFRTVAERLRALGVRVAPLPSNPPYPLQTPAAIIDEQRAVWIKAPEPLIVRESFVVPLSQPAVEVVLLPVVRSSAGSVNFGITFVQDEREISSTYSMMGTMRFELSPAPLLGGHPSTYSWVIQGSDTAGRTLQRSGHGILRPVFVERDTSYEDFQQGNALLLGRCAFDAATFEEFDSTLAAFILRAARNGKRIVLIGSTDAIGSDAYNRALARRRAEAALQRLGIPLQSVHIEAHVNEMHTQTLYDRVAQRGVFVRIEQH